MSPSLYTPPKCSDLLTYLLAECAYKQSCFLTQCRLIELFWGKINAAICFKRTRYNLYNMYKTTQCDNMQSLFDLYSIKYTTKNIYLYIVFVLYSIDTIIQTPFSIISFFLFFFFLKLALAMQIWINTFNGLKSYFIHWPSCLGLWPLCPRKMDNTTGQMALPLKWK